MSPPSYVLGQSQLIADHDFDNMKSYYSEVLNCKRFDCGAAGEDATGAQADNGERADFLRASESAGQRFGMPASRLQ